MIETINQALEYYRLEHVYYKVRSVTTSEICLSWVGTFFGNIKIEDLNQSHIDTYINDAREGLAPATIKRELVILIAALNYAKKRRITNVDIPSFDLPQEPKGKDRYLNKEELDSLLVCARSISDRLYMFIMIASNTGARKSAVLNLKWRQVDFYNKVIRFSDQDKYDSNKRKSIVPINSQLLDYLYNFVKSGNLLKQDEYVLGSNKDVRYEFNKAKHIAGLGTDVTPHTLRHSFASNAIMAGKDIMAVARIMGDDPKTVYDRYCHFGDRYLREAVEF